MKLADYERLLGRATGRAIDAVAAHLPLDVAGLVGVYAGAADGFVGACAEGRLADAQWLERGMASPGPGAAPTSRGTPRWSGIGCGRWAPRARAATSPWRSG